MKKPAHSLRMLPARAAMIAVVAWQLPSFGQTFISAMAGYIHLTEGEVFLDGRPIHPKASDFQHVMDGQRLRSAEGRAELMLTPGSFLRLGANSEIEIESAGLTHVRFRVTAGSAMIDLLSVYEKDSIAFLAGGCEVRFPQKGLYRLNAGDPPTLSVFHGKAVVISGGGRREIKAKQTVLLTNGETAAVERFDPKQKDSLDEWNQTRATTLAQAERDSRKNRRNGADEGMDPLYREWLEMTMRRPQPPVSSQPRNPQPRNPTPSPKR